MELLATTLMKKMTILHREDGPAVERSDGHKEWWVNNKELTPEEFSFFRQQVYKDNKTNVRTIY